MKATRHKKRHGLPYAMGDVSPWGDVAVAVAAVRQRLVDHGPQSVLVSAAGRVYLMRTCDPTTTAVINRHPDWHAGDFNAAVSAEQLRVALVHTYQKSLRALQAPLGATA